MDSAIGWENQVLERIDAGVDVTQIAERLKLTPTERLERLQAFVWFVEESRSPHGHELPAASRRTR